MLPKIRVDLGSPVVAKACIKAHGVEPHPASDKDLGTVASAVQDGARPSRLRTGRPLSALIVDKARSPTPVTR